MKFTTSLLGIIFLLFTQMFFISEKGYADGAEKSYKNYYGIAWYGKPIEDMKYARQMGYDYIAINPSYNPKEYHKNPDCAGLKFYLTDPYFYPQVLSEYSKTIDTTKPISDTARNFYNQRMVWKSNEPFPDNLATGYYPDGVSTKISIMWDLQQQAVIDEVVEKIIQEAKSYEKQDLSFTFGGYILDEPKLSGEFYRLDEHGKNVSVDLSHWAGVDSGLVHDTITHEYATYAEGRAAFYKQLFKRTREEWPNIKVVMEPYDIYNDWVKEIKDREDKNELMPDALFQENAGTAFVDDHDIFDSGLVRKDDVGSIQMNELGESENRLYAAKAAINGAWYNWSGGTDDRQDLQSITGVYPRLKLIRCLPNWDNLNHVPLTDRTWDGNIYQSTKSYLSSDVMYSRHPKTGKLFAVFLTLSGVITLNTGEKVTSVERTDGFFIESGDGSADINIVGNEITLKNRDNIGKGYIFSLSPEGDSSRVSTGSETDETSGDKASTGNNEVDANGIYTTAWFEYGTIKGSYSSAPSELTKRARGSKAVASQQSVITQTWQQVPIRTQVQKTAGLSGGEGFQAIFDIEYAPSDPNIVYFVTDTAGVWKSIDGGTSWQMKPNGFGANGGQSLSIHPTNPNVVFVAGGLMGDWTIPGAAQGIYRTTDGGGNWSLVKSAAYTRSNGERGGSLFAFSGANIVYAGTHDMGLLKSTDGGNTWSTIVQFSTTGKISDVKMHPTDATILFVSTINGLYKVKDSGSISVTKVGTGLPQRPRMVVINKNNPAIMYASVGTAGVYWSTNGGLNFSVRNNGMSATLNLGKEAVSLAISPADPNYLYICYAYGSTQAPYGFYYTHDGGGNWYAPTTMDENGLSSSLFFWIGSYIGHTYSAPIATHPTNRDIAVTKNLCEQLSKTINGGSTWRYSSSGYTGGIVGKPRGTSPVGWDPNNSQRFVMFLTDWGPFLTEDSGSTFRNLNMPLYKGTGASTTGALDPTPGSKVIVTATGSGSTQSLFITRDIGVNWTQIQNTDDNYQFIAFNPQNPNVIYAGKYKSTDKGYTWTMLTKTIIGMYKNNGNIVYALGSSGGSTIVYKSTDGGATWTAPYPAIPAVGNTGQVAIAPNNENRIYLTMKGNGLYIITGTVANNGIVKLKDYSNTMPSPNPNNMSGLTRDHFNEQNTYHVAVDPKNPNILYAGSFSAHKGVSHGVFCSTDYGETWDNVSYNLGNWFTPYGLAVRPADSYVYVFSPYGTWKLPPPSTTAIADTTAPNCSISINGGASSTNSTAVSLALSSTDNVGVEGYYLSTSSTTPLASAAGWTTVSSTTSYNANVPYTLSNGDGIKTVNVWYKDAAGNVSIVASDSITLDTSNVSGTTGLQALYKFDEGSGTIANDSSGNGNNGSISGATWATGKSGSGLSFDGNDYVNKATPSAVLKPSLEVATAAWVKMSATDTGGAEIVSMGDSYAIRVQTNGNIQFFYYNGTTWKSIITTGVNVRDGAWHHIVGQKTGTALQIYVDGISKASTPNTGTISYTQGTGLFIGKHGNSGTIYDFVGSIDDMRIYNRALSNQEVLDLYNNTSTVISNGLQSQYALNEGSGTIATDASGNGNNSTISGATWVTGKSGSGLSFDGNDYVVRTNPSAGLKPSLEVATAAWVKISATDTGGAEIVSMGDSYALRVQTSGNIQFFYYNGTTWESIITTGVNVRDGVWHHIVGQKTGTALQIYVDGISKASTPNTGTIAYTQGTGLFIGKHGNGDTIYDFVGSIDDVRIYNRALSNQEVQVLLSN